MTIFLALAGGALLLLIVLKLWAQAKASGPKAPTGGVVYATESSRIDAWVAGADDWWPHLRVNWLFFVGVLGTMTMLGLAIHFGVVRGGHWGLLGILIVASLFGMADLAIPFIALYDATDDGELSWLGTSLLTVATIMSILAMIGSTSEIATTTAARMDVGLINQKDTLKQLEIKQRERDSIQVDRGAQALGELAKQTSEAADREGNRTRCAEKCENLRKQALDYGVRAKEAERKEKLTAEIETLKSRLSGASASEQRTDADAMATVVSGMTGGLVSRDAFRVYFLPVIGIVPVTLMTLLWMYIGGKLYKAIQWERTHRGEIADEARATLGLPAKYGALAESTKLLTGPTTSAVEQGLVINVQAADMRKRYANDESLLETDNLFGSLMDKAEGGHVSIAALYRAYQVAILTRDPNGRYMTQPTMAGKLMIIAQNRDDVKVTADGVILGWVLKPADSRKLEVSHA